MILIGLFVLYSFLSLAEHTGSNGGGLLRENPPSQRAWFLLAPFKIACVIGIVLAGYFLIPGAAFSPDNSFLLAVAAVAVLFLGALAALTLVHRLAPAVSRSWPGLGPKLAGPLLTALRRLEGKVQNDTAGAGSSADGSDTVAVTQPSPLNITEEDLVSMDRHDREMLRSIIQLDNSTAHEVMVPRLDVITMEISTPLPQAIEPIINSGHTRIPVYEETIDHIVGIIHSLDLLKVMARDDWMQASLRDLVRTAYFIPETKRLDVLLEEFQQRAVQMAIVVDEYGGTEGIITMEDLLEEIVGEIEDEFSWGSEPEVKAEDDGAALVSASVTNDVIEEMFGAKLDNPDVDTIGGYVYMTLGRMPHVGDLVETDTLTIEIVSVLGRRIHKVRVKAKDATPL